LFSSAAGLLQLKLQLQRFSNFFNSRAAAAIASASTLAAAAKRFAFILFCFESFSFSSLRFC
jgi:hypothetical protein